jgi:hypothetical protein
VLGCIEAPPSSSRPTAAFAPQLLLPTCRAISASPPPRGSRSCSHLATSKLSTSSPQCRRTSPVAFSSTASNVHHARPSCTQLDRGLSSPSGNTAMRCTSPLCMSLPYSSMLCIAPPPSSVARPALRSGLTASQVPPRPSLPRYCRAWPCCPPCGSVPSRHASPPSAHVAEPT